MRKKSTTKDDISRLKTPENIVDALHASSPYVLRKAFERDPLVQRLFKSGNEMYAEVEAEIHQNASKLDEITLACFAYLLEQADPNRVVRCLGAPFKEAVHHPGPFFVHFAAGALKRALKLAPAEAPKGMEYGRGQQLEIAARL